MKTVDVVILSDQNNLVEFNASGDKCLGYLEDHILKEALEDEGLSVAHLSWDDPNFDWSGAKALIFRSTWDYFYRIDEFSAWLQTVSKQTTLINSESLIYCNLDKHYLKDLQLKGVHIAESYFIEKDSNTSLKQLHLKLGWEETVLMPILTPMMS